MACDAVNRRGGYFGPWQSAVPRLKTDDVK
eukprot:SAG11_NODE_21388_length_426_cov_0.788991_2_plen_29_part_01